MSMVARFVQITPDLLNELREEPDRVGDLFKEQLMPARGQIPFPDTMRAEALRRAPQALAASLGNLDPRIRAALERSLQNLGFSLDDLQTSKGADALKQLMGRGFGILAAAQAPAGPPLKGKGADISIDKAWHGVHYLLCGEAEPGSSLLSQVVLGGTEIGDDDFGYGPARYFLARQVADTARELSRADLETEMTARFDSKRMIGLGIYPQGWDSAGALDWLIEEFHHLKDFYVDAGSRQLAIVTCIV